MTARFSLPIAVLLVCGCVSAPQELACPQDAMLCPDGSAVVRTPPDCAFQPCPAVSTTTTQQPQTLKALSAATERPLYHSMETMWINLTVDSAASGVAEFYVHGISSRGRELLIIRENRTLEPGVNQIALKYQTPSCTGCAGIRPGAYAITAEVNVAGGRYAENMTVEIQQ